MKISKIYSNKQFKNIEFSFGLNIIIGEIKEPDKKNSDTHNLGKTKLIEIIDFLLLKGINNKKKHFLTRNKIFSGQIFFGEFLLNGGDYLIIKRSVDKNTKISIKINEHRLNSFKLDIKGWDFEDETIKKAKNILNNEFLKFDVLPKWNYRNSLNYFLRTQNDFLDVFKLGKFLGVHKNWKPVVFDLLNFNSQLLKEKYLTDEKIAEIKNTIKTLKNENKVETNKRDKLVGMIDIKTDEKNKFEKLIDKFNFYSSDNKKKENLVNIIDAKIQILNSQHYSLQYEINKINEALNKVNDEIDFSELETLFQEVNIYFPKNLCKNYEQLIDFNRKISIERNRFLIENLIKLKKKLKEIKESLYNLEKEKSEIILFLTEEDSYGKFKKYQKNLSKTEANIFILKEKLKIIDNITLLEERKNKEKRKQKEKILQINKEVAKQNHSKIRKLFNEIIFNLLNVPAIISVYQNKEGNIEFEAAYQNPDNFSITDEAKGATYKKILCSAFDIALLKSYNKKSYYRFVYHDGILDGLDIRIKKKHIKLIRNLVKHYNIQYIFTVIESELYDIEGKVEFSKKEICLRLSDISTKDKLFEIDF